MKSNFVSSTKIVSIIISSIILFGCNSSSFNKIELISYSGRALSYKDTDSLVFGLYIHFYAQIDNNGNCMVYRKSKQFEKKINSLSIDKQMIELIESKLRDIKNDTILSMKSPRAIYDGPTIQLLEHNYDKKIKIVTFFNGNNSDKDFVKLYEYLNSDISPHLNIDSFDTTQFILDRDKLIAQIYQNILNSSSSFNRDTLLIFK